MVLGGGAIFGSKSDVLVAGWRKLIMRCFTSCTPRQVKLLRQREQNGQGMQNELGMHTEF
jgi:hypothetical protein